MLLALASSANHISGYLGSQTYNHAVVHHTTRKSISSLSVTSNAVDKGTARMHYIMSFLGIVLFTSLVRSTLDPHPIMAFTVYVVV